MRLGSSALVSVKGKLKQLKAEDIIHNADLAPSLAQNLLSVGQMTQNGCSLYFNGDTCTIYDKYKNQTIAFVKLENKNFPIRQKYSYENSS